MLISRSRIFDLLLILLVLAAIALALSGVVEEGGKVPAGAVAVVNGHAISEELFDASLRDARDLKRDQRDGQTRAELLQRFIDEELLLQQAIGLDLPRKDSRIRSLLVQQMMQQIVRGNSRAAVDADAVRRFFEDNRAYFRRAGSYRVRRYRLADDAQARKLLAALASARSLDAWEDRRDHYMPDVLLPESKLHDYLGADLSDTLVASPVGASVVQPSGDAGVLVSILMQVRDASVPDFTEIGEQVEAEYRRQRDEATLDNYLKTLRRRASISLADDGGA